MRLAVAATAPFGADVLEGLAASHDISYLLTRPDRPRGRGRRVGPSPAKETAERLGIEVRQPEQPAGLGPARGGVGFPEIRPLIPAPVLDRARSLHPQPALLPRWPG